jgi:hypothetical protein
VYKARIVVIAVTVALGACAAPNFRRSAGNEQASNADFDRSQYECNLQVRQAAQGRWVSGGLLFVGIVTAANAAADRQLYVQCMGAHGYTALETDPNAAPKPMLLSTPAQVPATAQPVALPPPQAILPAPPPMPPGPIDPIPVAAAQLPARVAPVAIAGESKYMFTAEQFAKAHGCAQPLATMVVRQSFNETFSVDCQGRETVMVRCEAGSCRSMQ